MGKSKFVTLESSDGFIFVVEREAALVSGTLRGILESNCMSFFFSFEISYQTSTNIYKKSWLY